MTEASPSPELIATAAIIWQSLARRSKSCCHHFNKGLSSKVMDVCYLHHDDLSLLVITFMHRKQGHAQYMHIIMSCIQYAVTHSNKITSFFLFGHKTVSYLQIKQELNSFFFLHLEHKRHPDFNRCDSDCEETESFRTFADALIRNN